MNAKSRLAGLFGFRLARGSRSARFNYCPRLEALEQRTLLSNFNIPFTLSAVNPLGSLVYAGWSQQTIAAAGDTDTFTVTINPQQTLSAVVHPTASTFQPTLTLLGPSGNNLGSVTATAPGQDAVIPLVASAGGGTYSFVVSGAGTSTGTYNFDGILNALFLEPPNRGGPQDNTLTTAQALDSTAIPFVAQNERMAAEGTIESNLPAQTSASDFFSFQLNQGESASAVIFALAGGSNVQLTLEDDQGNVLALGSTGAANVSAAINNFVATAAGTYYLAVTGNVGINYNVVVTRGADFSIDPDNSLATPQDLTATQESGKAGEGGVLGYFNNTGTATDFYSVNANAGDNLHFATSTPSGGPNLFANGFYSELLLYDPNGNLVAVAAGNASDGRNSVIDFTVPGGDAGAWSIEVTASPNTSTPSEGEYGLLVTGATGALSPFVVTATDPASGASIGLPLSVTMTFNEPVYGPSLTDGELEINGVAATGVTLDDADSVTWTIPASAFATGTMLPNVVTLGADASGNQVENISRATLTPYSYTFFTTSSLGVSYPTPLQAQDPLGSLIYDPSVSGSIASSGNSNTYALPLAAGQTLTLFLTSGSGLTGAITLKDPVGNIIATATGSTPGAAVVLENAPVTTAGTYSLIASGADNTTGSYTLQAILNAAYKQSTDSINSIGTAYNLASAFTSLNTAVQADRAGVIGVLGSSPDFYSVPLTAGEAASIAVKGSGGAAAVALYDGSGNPLALPTSGSGVDAIISNFVAPATGTYYVKVTGAASLTYDLVVTHGSDFDIHGNSFNNAQQLNGAEVALGDLTGGDVTQDWYSFNVNAGDNLVIATTTPGASSASGLQFVNNFNPTIDLYDASGDLIAVAEGNASDGRNSIVDYTPTTSGSYRVEIQGATMDSVGEYTVSVQGATGGTTPLTVTSTNPAANADLPTQVSAMTVSFSGSIRLSSLSDSDFTIDGNEATGFTVLDSQDVSFGFPTTTDGEHNVSISGISGTDGTVLTTDNFSFQTDDVPPTVVSSSIANGAMLSAGPLTEVITFSKPVNSSTVSAADILLEGELRGLSYMPSSFSFDPTDTILTVNYSNLPTDNYQLTLLAGADNFTSLAGVPLQSNYGVSFSIGPIPMIATSQQPANAAIGTSIADKATVSGGDSPGGTVTFNLYSDSTATGTPLFSDSQTLFGGIATSAGYTATATGTDYWVATYNGDSNNPPVSSGAGSEPVIVTLATPMINTSQQPASVTVGTSIADKATVSGGYNPTGTVTFKLYNNSAGTGTPLFTDANVALSGGIAISTGYTPTATGTDYWVATYSGNSDNFAVSSGAASGPVTVNSARPSINTSQQPASITFGKSIADQATLSGGYNPTGTITFDLYNNSTGTGTPLFIDANVPLSGGMATSTGYTPTAAATDYWVAAYSGDSDNSAVSSGAASEPVSVIPATATIVITPYSVTYDGNSHTAAGTATGIGNANLDSDLTLSGTTHTDAGTYAVDAWSFHDPSGNYNDASGTVSDSIARATPVVSVSDPGGVFNNSPYPATAMVEGVGPGAAFAPSLEAVFPTLTYYAGSTATGTPLGGPPVNVGTYTVVASFAGSSDYTPASNVSTTFRITTATTVIHASDPGGVYNGNPFPATGYVADAGGAAIATPVFTYYLASDKTLSNPLPGAPSNAGSYAYVAKFAGNGNYLSTATSGTFSISKASPVIHASDLGGVYDGKAFPATGNVTGVGGVSVATPVFTYYLASDKTFSHPLPGAPSSPGSYAFMATFAGNSNYLPAATTAPFSVSIPVTSFTASSIHFVAGATFSGVVAQFSAPAGLAASLFSATITWGDGTTSSATVIATAKAGQFQITASHKWIKSGTYTTTITLLPAGSAARTATGSAT